MNNKNSQIEKYKNDICDLIMKTYNVDKAIALAAINRSGLDEALNFDAELVFHLDSEEEWVRDIWYGYIKSKSS